MAEPNRPTAKSPRSATPPAPAADMGATVVADAGKTHVGPADPGATQIEGGSTPPSAASSGAATGDFTGAPGTRLGKYEIVKKLGQGGMGAVYLAKDVDLDRRVALKTMTRELAAKADFVARFKREAKAMAKVTHTNIVQIYDVGDANGQPYAAIEFIDGQSLQKWMDQLKKLSLADAVHATVVCCEALKLAHDQNTIHRDIKPDNILVTSKGVIKVADFGLAKATDEDVSMTQSGTGLGTPLYMAPEQARNAKHVDQRTDIYALGCMLYYFVTGKLPYTGTSTLELIMAKEQGRYTPPRKLNPEVPERLDLIIGKMIEKDPKNRYASCGDVARDLLGLGLAGDSLSFISGADRTTLGRAAATGSTPSTAPAKPTGVVPRSSADDAARKQTQAAAADTKTYIVQYTDKAGKAQVKKLTTIQVLQAVKDGVIDAKAKAKTSAQGDWVPLAQIREFSSAVEKRTVAAKAEQKAGSLKDQFAKIDKQYQRRGLTKWFQNLVSNVKGLISLAVYLAILAGVAWAGWTYGMPMVKQMMNKSETAAPAAAPAKT